MWFVRDILGFLFVLVVFASSVMFLTALIALCAVILGFSVVSLDGIVGLLLLLLFLLVVAVFLYLLGETI